MTKVQELLKLEFMKKRNSKRRMGYFFGAQRRKELYYTEMFEKLEKEMHDFKYYPILSQPTEACEWDGRCGYVLPFFDEFIKDMGTPERYEDVGGDLK